MRKNIMDSRIAREHNLKISTCVVFTVSVLVALSTLAIALYSMFFVKTYFAAILPYGQLAPALTIFNSSLQKFVLACLFFGLLTAYFITKIILNPLTELIKGTHEIAKGNLSYRLKKSRYSEISVLVDTYNKMAEALQTLYKDLEKKVQDRTKELSEANEQLKSTQVMMVHSEKMRSLGQLVAGITHEINNPVNFIHGNLVYLRKYTDALFELIAQYEMLEGSLSEEQKKAIAEVKEKIELSYIKEDLPSLIRSCQEGTERTKNIVMDLKNFSRLDEMVVSDIDLPREIDTTLNILHNKIKNRIEVVKEYNPDVPIIEGYGGQLNQVFMNILDNACYAIKNEGKIFIRLKKEDNHVIIEFEDTGAGIAKEKMDKIFEPFYTTKPVGEGTGLGMAISYKVIQCHNGKIEVNSELGKGTVFKITLPICMKAKV
jgi:two-component system NtrC family sensor kinase